LIVLFLPASVLAEPSTKRGTMPTESVSYCSQGGTTIIECVEAVIDSYASVVKYRDTVEPHKWTTAHLRPTEAGWYEHEGGRGQIEYLRRRERQMSAAINQLSTCIQNLHNYNFKSVKKHYPECTPYIS